VRRVLAAVLAVVGVIWVGQGIGVIPGSFMTSDLRWAVAGAVLLVLAALLARSPGGGRA
jgi:hypothetical protein